MNDPLTTLLLMMVLDDGGIWLDTIVEVTHHWQVVATSPCDHLVWMLLQLVEVWVLMILL